MSEALWERRAPRFCGQCGAELPPNNPRFCVECGRPVRAPAPPDAAAEPPPPAPATTGPTVRLGNARGEQTVVGGTVKLPTSGAIPPGLWFLTEPPGAEDVVAVYVPLRAVVGGWSATTSDGWHKRGQAWADDGTSRDLVRFEVEREWFPAQGAGRGLLLRVRIGASSHADEGHTRRGFRYRIGADPPMEVLEAWWYDPTSRQRQSLPIPQIQLMAPPRARRISDFAETIRRLNAREAESWARAGVIHGIFHMPDSTQQRTPAGRGIPLFEVPGGSSFQWLTGRLYQQLYRVQAHHPLICRPGEWPKLIQRIKEEARVLGLDMGTDAVIEWWLERQGYDCVQFERGAHRSATARMVVAFRRSQIAQIVE